jgi:hypothetical protein
MTERNFDRQENSRVRLPVIRTDEQLESLLLRRLDDQSPGIEATPHFWEEFKLRVEARRRKGHDTNR